MRSGLVRLSLMVPIVSLFSGCFLFKKENTVSKPTDTSTPPPASVPFLNQLKTVGDYSSLQFTDDVGLNHVKYSFFFSEAEPKVFFQNTTAFNFHMQFFKEHVPIMAGVTNETYETFLRPGPQRKILGGAIYWAPDKALEDFGRVPGTLGVTLYFSIDFNDIETIVNKIKEAAPFAEGRVAFLFDKSTDFVKNKRPLAEKKIASSLLNTFINQGLTPRSYHIARSYGFLRKVTPQDMEDSNYTSKDILILDELPLDLAPTSGILSNIPQPPHSHVIFRSINQNIPNAFLPGVLERPEVKKYLGKLVEYETKANGEVSIKGADELGGEQALNQLAETYFASRKPNLPPLRFDLNVTALRSIKADGITKDDMAKYGAKATNFAFLDSALRANPETAPLRKPFDGGMMSPLAFYSTHISQPLTDKICAKALEKCEPESPGNCSEGAGLCKDLAKSGKPISDLGKAMFNAQTRIDLLSNAARRKGNLEFMRQTIRRAPLPSSVETAIMTAVKSNFPPTTRVRFRSSTNAEDLAGLTGAGLYVSKSICIADEGSSSAGKSACMTPLEETRIKKKIEILTAKNDPNLAKQIAELQEDLVDKDELKDAVRTVYASIWGEKAYLNRDFFELNHHEVFMGGLIHPSFTDETANGVAILTALEGGKFSISIVAQREDVSVTNPEIPGALPEEWIVETAQDGSIVQAQTVRNSTFGTGPVLTQDWVKSLAKQMVLTQVKMAQVHGDAAKRLDIEFIIDPNQLPLIKQARPL